MATIETTIGGEMVQEFEKRAVRINKKLAAAGLPPMTYEVTRRFEESALTAAEVADISLEFPTMEELGHEMIAVFKPAPERGHFTFMLGENDAASIPRRYLQNSGAECEHCRVQRNRKTTVLLRSEKGEYYQVGSTCIEDFLGGASTKIVAGLKAVDRLRSDLAEPRWQETAPRYPAMLALAATIEHLMHHDFIPSYTDGEMNDDATWRIVWEKLEWLRLHGEDDDGSYLDRLASPTARQWARKVSDWFRGWLDADDQRLSANTYNMNAFAALNNPVCQTGMPYLASLPNFFKSKVQRRGRRAEPRNAEPSYTKGHSFQIEGARVAFARQYDGRYGPYTFAIIRHDGEKLTTRTNEPIERGDILSAWVTVKEIKTYQGELEYGVRLRGVEITYEDRG